MSEIKPKIPDNNSPTNQNLDQINNTQMEYNPKIPLDTIKFRRKLSRINTQMKRIIQKIENQFPKNVGSLYDGKYLKVKAVRNIGISDKILYKDPKDSYNVFSNEDHIIKDLMTQFKEKKEKEKYRN